VVFYATDKDGSDGEAVGIYVYPVPEIQAFAMSNGTPAYATIPSVDGQEYQLQYSTNIWELPVLWNLVESEMGTGGNITLQDTNTLIDIKRYYRIVLP
jgi:hypothetical protein